MSIKEQDALHASRTELYKRLALRGVLLVLGFGAFLWAAPVVLPIAAPFLVALLVAMALNPLVGKMEEKLHINRRISAFVLTFVFVGAVFVLLGWLVYTIANELISMAANVSSIWSYLSSSLDYLSEKLAWLTELLPANSENTLEALTESVYSGLQSASKNILDTTISLAANTTTRVGNIFMATTISLLAAYFMIADYPRLSGYAKAHVDNHVLRFLRKIKRAVQSAFSGYIKSQLLLALLAFSVMFLALALSGQRYSLVIALGLGIVDFLPIVGTIAVLLPWAVIEFWAGNVAKSIFLLVLAVGFFLLRRMVEPKIVGSQTGLHPVIALLSIYAGMKLSGVWGAVLGPVVVMIGKNIYLAGIFDGALADIKDLYQIVRAGLKRRTGSEKRTG